MTVSDVKDIILFLIAIVGCVVGVYGFSRNRKQDIKGEEKASSEIHEALLKLNLKTDQICATTNETRTDIKAMDRRLNEINTEVEVVKRDVQTAFMRIDELKDKMKG